MRIRRDFVGARLLHSLGHGKEADRLFKEVVAADLENAFFKDAFLDLFYLFGMHVREGEIDKAAETCRSALNQAELAAVSHDQIRDVWSMLLETVQQRAVTQVLIGDVRRYISIHWRQPSLEAPLILKKLGELRKVKGYRHPEGRS